MHIVQIEHSKVPVNLYGGTERIVETLCRNFTEMGHQVTLISYKGDYEIPGVNFIDLMSLGSKEKADSDYLSLIPEDADIVHFHLPREQDELSLKHPYVCTLHGNEDNEEKRKSLPKYLIGISENHRHRHNLKHFVYNGLDFPTDILNKADREGFSFLGRASLKRKGLHNAKDIIKALKEKLYVGGGRGFSFGNVKYLGHLNDQEKYKLMGNTKALLFPIEWEEPFGLVMIEAMACGTPVFAFERGSVSEVLGLEGSEGLFITGKDSRELIDQIKKFSYPDPKTVRSYLDKYFSGKTMAENYLKKYELVLSQEW